jgi:hypothetical protein
MMTLEMTIPSEPESQPPSEGGPTVEPGPKTEPEQPLTPPGDSRDAPGDGEAQAAAPAQGMIPGRARRRTKVERVSMRVLATGGIVGIAAILGAVLVGQHVAGWIVGVTIGVTSVILAALLWSSRQL